MYVCLCQHMLQQRSFDNTKSTVSFFLLAAHEQWLFFFFIIYFLSSGSFLDGEYHWYSPSVCDSCVQPLAKGMAFLNITSWILEACRVSWPSECSLAMWHSVAMTSRQSDSLRYRRFWTCAQPAVIDGPTVAAKSRFHLPYRHTGQQSFSIFRMHRLHLQ